MMSRNFDVLMGCFDEVFWWGILPPLGTSVPPYSTLTPAVAWQKNAQTMLSTDQPTLDIFSSDLDFNIRQKLWTWYQKQTFNTLSFQSNSTFALRAFRSFFTFSLNSSPIFFIFALLRSVSLLVFFCLALRQPHRLFSCADFALFCIFSFI